MNLLTFDTCLNKMFISLGNEEMIFSSKIIETVGTTYHSAYLISKIVEILKENNLSPNDIDAIATNKGPGSFTGIRCCITVARVLAQSRELKAIGISSLEILSRINETNKKTFVALNARKNKAYVGIYDKNIEIFEPKAVLIEDVKKMSSKDDYFIITDDALKDERGGISYGEAEKDLGIYANKIAIEKLKKGIDTNWRKLMPLYIQPPAMNVKSTAIIK